MFASFPFHPLPVSLVGTIHDLLKHRLGNPMLVGSADWMTEATIVPVPIKSILREVSRSKAFKSIPCEASLQILIRTHGIDFQIEQIPQP